MRISTTLSILKRAIDGDTPEGIAVRMHLGRDTVTDLLDRAGWPDLAAIAEYRAWYRTGGNADRAIAEDAAILGNAARHDPDWIEQYTEWKTRQQLRTLIRVMAEMLPAEVDPLDARAWKQGGRGGRPKKAAAA